MATTTVNYLIPDLRLHLHDLDSTSYRYLDAWLTTALLASIKVLQRWWNFKYLVDSSNRIYRNPNKVFLFNEPPVVENADERPITLMAAIIIKEGSLENSSWNYVIWRDNEVSFSNRESSQAKQVSLKADWDELTSLVTPPTKKLASPLKGDLPGYIGNIYERGTDL